MPDRRAPPPAPPWRFLCTRRGAATARAAMLLCAAVLSVVTPVATWAGSQLWQEFTETKKAVTALDRKIDAYLAAVVVRRENFERRIVSLEGDSKATDGRLDDHERRIYRMEGNRR